MLKSLKHAADHTHLLCFPKTRFYAPSYMKLMLRRVTRLDLGVLAQQFIPAIFTVAMFHLPELNSKPGQ